MTSTELFEATEMLPVEMKLKLIDKLLSSITKIEYEKEWKQEVLKRQKEVLQNRVILKSKEEIFNKLRNI